MPEIEQVLPKYLRISGYIRDRIERGELAPGAEVPSERELAAQWKVARPTAAKALNALRQLGIVESRRGSGTYVADRRGGAVLRERAPQYGPGSAEVRSTTVLDAALVVGPAQVTAALGLREGSAVIRRKHSTATDSGVTEFTTSWFPGVLADTAGRLLVAERLPGGTLHYLESVTGQQVSHLRDRIGARLATAEERRHLELSDPAAVLVYQLTLHVDGGPTIQFDEVVHPPGQWVFQREYPAGS